MNAVIFRHCFAGVFAFLLTYYLIPLLIKSAHQLGLLDKPDGKIKVHKNPIPHFGGLAIFTGFIATLAISYPFQNIILWLLLGSTLLLLLGLIDDLKILKPSQKFIGQTFAVICFLKGGFSLKSVFFASWSNLLLSGFWMLSVINAFNLIDVMDGLTATVALTAVTTFFILALFFQQYALSLLLITFMGAVFAFFMYNRPPAKIYMGDAGAMFIGGFLSAVPLLFPWSRVAFDAYYAPAIILAIPALEVVCLIVIRLAKGIPPYQGSPHHFSIYLQQKGWSKNHILIFTASAGVILSIGATLFALHIISLLALILSGVIFIAAWIYTIFFGFQPKNTIIPSVRVRNSSHDMSRPSTQSSSNERV